MSDSMPLQPGSAADSGPMRLEKFFSDAYSVFRANLDPNIQDGMNITDLGSKDGAWDAWIDHKSNHSKMTLVDIDQTQLDAFKNGHFKARKNKPDLYGQENEFETVCEDINVYLDKVPENSQDLILFNATLHEINDSDNQEEFLQKFLGKIKRILKPGKRIILGDYFTGSDVSDEDFERFMKIQAKRVGHADSREKFIDPELVRKVAESLGLKIVAENNIQAAEEINRRYYLFVFEK